MWWLPTSGPARIFELGAPHSADGLAFGDGSLWIASGADDRVLRLDPRTGRIVAQISIAAVPQARVASPYGIAVGDGAVWVTDALADTVSRVDPRLNAVTATIPVGRRPTRVAVSNGAAWVLNAGDGTVSRIDPDRNLVSATIHVGGDATGIAAGLGSVWVTVGGGPPRGGTSPRPAAVSALSSPSCPGLVTGPGGRADLLIASDLPTYLGGAQPEPLITDMRAAIRLVLQQRGFRAGRYRIGYQACDDSRPNEGADPQLCASNARAYALDPGLVGVIGTYNSFCSGIELPALNSAPGGPVAMISPSNTYVGLTHSGPATAADEPDRYYPTGTRNFVRLPAADDYQSAGIDLFLKQLGRKRLYLLDDGSGTGYAGSTYARRSAAILGLTIVGATTWDPNAPSYLPLARQIAHAGADAVLLSGCICSNGGKLVTDLRSVLRTSTTLIGTDNFGTSEGFIHTHRFDGLYISVAGLPARALPGTGKAFLSRLFPGRALDNVDEGVAYAAQATEILLDAIARSDGTPASITRQLIGGVFGESITGSVSFNSHGDPTAAPISIYRVDSNLPPEPRVGAQGLALDRVVKPDANDLG